MNYKVLLFLGALFPTGAVLTNVCGDTSQTIGLPKTKLKNPLETPKSEFREDTPPVQESVPDKPKADTGQKSKETPASGSLSKGEKSASVSPKVDISTKHKDMPLTDRAKLFIEELISKGILYWKDKPYDEQVAEFKKVMESKFDIDGIAKRVIGSFMWNQMDPVQRKKYLMTFRQMLLNRYSKKFNQYGGQNVVVTDATESVKRFPLGVNSELLSSQIAVTSELQNEGSAPVKVEWYVAEYEGNLIITDITLAGPSMVSTEQATFTAIQRNPANFGQAKKACAGVDQHRMKKCIADQLLPKIMDYMLTSN